MNEDTKYWNARDTGTVVWNGRGQTWNFHINYVHWNLLAESATLGVILKKKTVFAWQRICEVLLFVLTLMWLTAEDNFSELCFVAVIVISLPEHSAQNEA